MEFFPKCGFSLGIFFWREGLHGQGMDLFEFHFQSRVDTPLALQQWLLIKRGGNDENVKRRAASATDVNHSLSQK